jgi:hypothetical protein
MHWAKMMLNTRKSVDGEKKNNEKFPQRINKLLSENRFSIVPGPVILLPLLFASHDVMSSPPFLLPQTRLCCTMFCLEEKKRQRCAKGSGSGSDACMHVVVPWASMQRESPLQANMFAL